MRFKQILTWGVSVSLLYNLVWIGIFALVASFLVQQMILVSLLFLMVYIFIAQPIKDWMYTVLLSKYVFSSGSKYFRLEQKLQQVSTLDEAFKFLSELVKFWRQPRMRLVVYKPEERILFISESGYGKWISFRRPELGELVDFLSLNPWAANVQHFDARIRSYLYNRRVRSVAPVIFRDALVGFLGFATALKPDQLEFAEFVSRRIAVVIENDLLKQNIPRTEVVKREFSLAQRVEDHLVLQKRQLVYHDYIIEQVHESWRQKYFPAVLSTGLGPVKATDSLLGGLLRRNPDVQPLVMLLCRLAHRPHRASAIQLYVVKGYFHAAIKHSKAHSDMVEFLQKMITSQEAGRIELDGFVVFAEQKSFHIHHFGKDLKVMVDGKWRDLPERDPLGSEGFRSRSFRLRTPLNIELNIKGFSLLHISQRADEPA